MSEIVFPKQKDKEFDQNRRKYDFEDRNESFGSSLMTMQTDPRVNSDFPKTSLILLTENGQLFTTMNLFDPEQYPSTASLALLFSKIILRLKKLNGIAEVESDKIKFFNGKTYRFLDKHRRYLLSRGEIINQSDSKSLLFKKLQFY